MNIRTDYIFPPIPDRRFDWSAIDDDSYCGHGSSVGYGRTEQEAVDDLRQQMDEDGGTQ